MPPGLETAPTFLAARPALALKGGPENAGISKIWGFHRCTGRLNATQPGVLAVSSLYIRGLVPPCKRSVAGRQHSSLFTWDAIREPLILCSYCGTQAAGGVLDLTFATLPTEGSVMRTSNLKLQ